MDLFLSLLDSDSSQILIQGDQGEQDEVVRRRHGDKEVTFLSESFLYGTKNTLHC